MPNTAAGRVPAREVPAREVLAREVLAVKVATPDKVRKKDLTEGPLHTTPLKNLWIQVM
jgi:hypothetical protein